jgi:hypothetical protein
LFPIEITTHVQGWQGLEKGYFEKVLEFWLTGVVVGAEVLLDIFVRHFWKLLVPERSWTTLDGWKDTPLHGDSFSNNSGTLHFMLFQQGSRVGRFLRYPMTCSGGKKNSSVFDTCILLARR